MTRSLLIIALLALFAPQAQAQDQDQDRPVLEGYEFLPESRWLKLKNPDLRKKFYVEGRWLEFYRPGIRFFKRNEMGRFLIVQGTPDDPLYSAVVANKDSLGNPLVKKQSMVRVFGTPQRWGGTRIALLVDKLEKLPDEHMQFKKRLEQAGDDLEVIRKLAADCRTRAQEMDDDDLRAVARIITESELRARRKGLSPQDHKGLLDLARRYEHELKDPNTAITLYGEVVEDRTAPRAIKGEARRQLLKKKAVRMRSGGSSKWVTYAEFKHAEGFVYRRGNDEAPEEWRRGDRWIKREWAELEDARQEELEKRMGKVVAVRTNLHQHSEAAKKGKLERGQNFVEVSRAVGLPSQVNHWPGELEGKAVVWSQWLVENGTRIYFVEGEVISIRPTGTRWPASQWSE